MFGFYMGLIVVVVLLIVLFGALVRHDEKQSYSFRELQLQLHDNKGEKLYCEITFYPWQRHKYEMIRLFYGVGKVVFVSERVYEIEEVRGPYRCSDAIFQNELQLYVKEKKKKDSTIVGGGKVFIFEDNSIYFDTTPYLEELRNVYDNIFVGERDENRINGLVLLLEELYSMSSTNTIRIQKIMPYLELLHEFGGINNNQQKINILSVMEEILKYIKKINMGCLVEKESEMGKDTLTLNVHGGQVNIANENGCVYAIQNNSMEVEELDVVVKNIMQNLDEIASEDAETIIDAVEMVREEIRKTEPSKKIISNGIRLLAPMISIVNGIPVLAENLMKFVEYINALIK